MFEHHIPPSVRAMPFRMRHWMLIILLPLVVMGYGGLAAATMLDAENAILRKDYVAARALLQDPAREGDAQAEDMLGHMLLFGRGGGVDVAAAEALLRKAAEKGQVEAQNTMGIIYMTGINGTIDPQAGIAWFRKAAAGGHAHAMFNLGRAAEQGLGMPKSTADAKVWYAQAAAKGNATAKIRLKELLDAQAPPKKATPDMRYSVRTPSAPPVEETDVRLQHSDALSALRQTPFADSAHNQAVQNEAANAQPEVRGEAKPELSALKIRRKGRTVELSWRLKNHDRRHVAEGIYRFWLIKPGGAAPLPLDSGTGFRVTRFADKRVSLTLPTDPPKDSQIRLEVVSGGEVLCSHLFTLPRR